MAGRGFVRPGALGAPATTRWRAAALVVLLSLSPAGAAELTLSDPESEVYYRYALAAGEKVQVEKDVEVTGDLHSNGDVQLKKDSSIDGDVTAVGPVDLRGTVSGSVSEGEEPLVLPELLDEAALRALADRVFERDTTFTDATIDDVVFVAGTARVRGDLGGSGTVIATRDVRLDTTGGGGFAPLAEETRLSLVAGNDVRIGKDRPFRGVLRAGRDIQIEPGVVFEGVVVADRTIHVKLGARVTFLDFDQEAPEIELVSPADGSFLPTPAPEVRVAYSDDLSGVRLDGFEILLDGVDVTAAAAIGAEELTFTPEPLADGLHALEVAVTDHSDNEARESFGFTTDTVPPEVAVTSPAQPVLYNSVPPIAVEYADATSGVDLDSVVVAVDGVPLAGCTVEAAAASCPAPELDEGEHTVTVDASDVAGNASTASFTFELIFDTEPPSLVIAAPAAPVLFNDATPEVAVEYTDAVSGVDTSTLVVSLGGAALPGCAVGPSAATCEPPELGEGTHTVGATVADRAGNEASASFVFELIFDTEPPTIDLSAPDHVTLERGGRALANVVDNVAVADVVFRLDGVELARASTPPFEGLEVEVVAPAGAEVGDVLVLTVEASDPAGNVATVSHDVRVAAAGVVVGQVLSDATGHPLAGARVRLLGEEDRVAVTDAEGRYSLPVSGLQVVLRIESADGSTVPVERRLDVVEEVGTVAVDARLRPRGPAVTLGADGGAVEAEGISLAVPAGALAAATPVRLTPLGAQGLPGLLPLGWSPLFAFEVDAPAGFQSSVEATIDALPSGVLHLARYRPSDHRWAMVEPEAVVGGGPAAVGLAEPGSYALLALDADASVEVPAAGGVLPGVDAEALPAGAVCEGEVLPPVLPPSGGTARGVLSLLSPLPLPSGTVVRTEVTETFRLALGTEGSEEVRSQDVVFYRRPAPPAAELGAEIPVVPVRTFDTGELVEARVRVEILSGRVGTRGRVGGEVPVTVTSGGATLEIAAGSLAENTTIALEAVEPSSFLPARADLVPLAEVVVDLSGKRLAVPAALSVDGSLVAPGDSLLVARVERIDGVPRPVVVAPAELAAGRVVSAPHPELPGITRGGRYAVYRSAAGFGLVTGVTRSDAGPVRAVVETDRWPFVALSGPDGRYTVAAPAGPATVTARVPSTSLAGSASVEVVAGGTAVADILLAGAVTTATVSPADGAGDVPVSAQVEVESPVPFDRATVTAGAVELFAGPVADGQTVPVRLVLSASGLSLSVIPESRLEPSTTYTFTASGLADALGGLVDVPTAAFTTAAEREPLQVDPDRIVVTFPDADGLVRVQAPPGTLPPGTTILILNTGNGVAVSLTVGNDGSLDGEIPATIDDVLELTLVDPQGNVLTLESSRFVAQDGSGRTAVGAGGGVVEGPGGTELRIPEGALDEGAVFAVEPLGREAFPELPEVPNGAFGGGLLVTAPPDLDMKKPGDLVFPKPPDAPDGSFYYVYRLLSGPGGQVGFEVIDHAFVEGEGTDAKVVTASYPFIGWKDSTASWQAAADGAILGFGLASQTSFNLMYSFDAALPGLATQGLITGTVTRPVFEEGAADPVTQPIPDVAVTTDDAGTTLTRTDADGVFSLLDPLYLGGAIEVTASANGEVLTATAFQADPDTTRDNKLPIQYRNVAVANFGFPVEEPPPPAPRIEIHVMTVDPVGNRKESGGFVASGDEVLIGFKLQEPLPLQGTTATFDGRSVAVRQDFEASNLPMDFVLQDRFTPSVPGSQTVTFTAFPTIGPSTTVEETFVVVGPAGNTETLPGEPPAIVTDRLIPRPGAEDVSTEVNPQVVFSEPVVGVAASLRLIDAESGQEVETTLPAVAVGPDGSAFPVADLRKEDVALPVVSVTARPLAGLSFGSRYLLTLQAARVHDLDVPARTLAGGDLELDFTTVKPDLIGLVLQEFRSTGLAVLDDLAYVAKGRDAAGNGAIAVYDVSDPRQPTELQEASTSVPGRVVDLAGEAEVESLGTSEAILVTTHASNPTLGGPSNLFLWDVSHGEVERIGAVSLTQSFQEGVALDVVVKAPFAYANTSRAGDEESGTAAGTTVDVIDLRIAKQLYEQAVAAGRSLAGLSVADVGFGQKARTRSIPVSTRSGQAGHLIDLKVGNFIHEGRSKTLLVAAGNAPVTVVDRDAPKDSAVLFNDDDLSLESSDPDVFPGRIDLGHSLALGHLDGRPVAVVTGIGQATENGSGGLSPTGPVLAVVDLSDPAGVVPLGFTALEGNAVEVLLTEQWAIVSGGSGATLVDVSSPSRPTVVDTIPFVKGHLALSWPNRLISSWDFLRVTQLGSFKCATLFQEVPTPTELKDGKNIGPILDWQMTVQRSDDDGFVLKYVKLGDRLMSKSMSLPYFRLQLDGLDTMRCELRPDETGGPGDCSGAPTSRSRLVAFDVPESVPEDATHFTVTATYMVDRLLGNPENPTTPDVPDACILVTQQYEFWREGVDACEVSGGFSCARFKPIVRYQYVASPGAPSLSFINTAQRLDHQPTTLEGDSAPRSMVTIFRDCEPLCSPLNLNGEVARDVGGNPLERETILSPISDGKVAEDALPDEYVTELAELGDNIHFAPWSEDKNRIDGPTVLGHAGCPECVHMHWRWGRQLRYDNAFLNDNPFWTPKVSPRFDNNEGLPIIPAGSNQSVDIAVLAVRGSEFETDPPTYLDVFEEEPIFEEDRSPKAEPLALWYLATSSRNQDRFFIHGGFFSSLRLLLGNPKPAWPAIRVPVTVFTEKRFRITIDAERVQPDGSTLPFGRHEEEVEGGTRPDPVEIEILYDLGSQAPDGAPTAGDFILTIRAEELGGAWSTTRKARVAL